MSTDLACFAGGPLYKALTSGRLKGRQLEAARTPFGDPEAILLVEDVPAPFYLVPRHLPGGRRRGPWQLHYRATLYALKDLGVRAVLDWAAAGAITHTIRIGQIVLPEDLIDFTRRREQTFFDQTALGLLRQFPVFCPSLRAALEGVLVGRQVDVRATGTAAVTEGPRLETAAEVRMLAGMGAELVTHSIAPLPFLARELQMCMAGALYVVNYAETGSLHRPFSVGSLFGGLTEASDEERLTRLCDILPEMLTALADRVSGAAPACTCGRTMAAAIEQDGLDEDWRRWFD
ncbi:MAG TPA: MTAP family purine nucleoside phosphorylase [Phycisphaerae bacterium]|nr:MTAP family purine nucleoside phosphorylase [Phycisphaerae bacterium]